MFSTRTHFARCLVVALAAVSGFVVNGCKSGPTAPHPVSTPEPVPAPTLDPQPAPVTQIRGTGSLPAGAGGNLGNARAALYRSVEEWRHNLPVAFVRVTGEGAQVSFAFVDLLPGTYYLDVWKDTDNSTAWTPGDFAGWFGNGSLGSPELTPLQVGDGETLDAGDLFMRPIMTHEEVGGR